ncbi:uncharacterized protein JCM6883_000821 [Sporobolomyces salmoneus]|uniref:uncharacterized protein n=1 Tax=Sporobolomyces salmoneus TaxID=183962 RepID=UPI003177F3B7
MSGSRPPPSPPRDVPQTAPKRQRVQATSNQPPTLEAQFEQYRLKVLKEHPLYQQLEAVEVTRTWDREEVEKLAAPIPGFEAWLRTSSAAVTRRRSRKLVVGLGALYFAECPAPLISLRDDYLRNHAQQYLQLYGYELLINGVINPNEARLLCFLAYPKEEDSPSRGIALLKLLTPRSVHAVLKPYVRLFGEISIEGLRHITLESLYEWIDLDEVLVMDDWKILADSTYSTSSARSVRRLQSSINQILIEGGVDIEKKYGAPEVPILPTLLSHRDEVNAILDTLSKTYPPFVSFLEGETRRVSLDIEGVVVGAGKGRDDWLEDINTVCAGEGSEEVRYVVQEDFLDGHKLSKYSSGGVKKQIMSTGDVELFGELIKEASDEYSEDVDFVTFSTSHCDIKHVAAALDYNDELAVSFDDLSFKKILAGKTLKLQNGSCVRMIDIGPAASRINARVVHGSAGLTYLTDNLLKVPGASEFTHPRFAFVSERLRYIESVQASDEKETKCLGDIERTTLMGDVLIEVRKIRRDEQEGGGTVIDDEKLEEYIDNCREHETNYRGHETIKRKSSSEVRNVFGEQVEKEWRELVEKAVEYESELIKKKEKTKKEKEKEKEKGKGKAKAG